MGEVGEDQQLPGTPINPMVLPVRRHTIRRELERREQHRGGRRFRPIRWWLLLLLLGFIVVVVCRLLLSPAAPFPGPGGSCSATASWAGGIEGQEGTSTLASPSSLNGEPLAKKVRRLLQKHDESILKKYADACMQPHCSPSGGGKTDQGLCIGDVLAHQLVVDSLADATIHHGWGGQSIFLLTDN